ncbi:granulocyte colony-stimulating factor isoform X1 [Talpa occidentalis]|uniref:granulocyte colony-stimulating factor isoform X1 n=1 Tax=Talpa occidentalis TaxID=50954 RepID=UPI0023F74A7A|nr:granulocyte colony-stimulating factor isoform X1 [Talpa occidentalis]
MGLRSLAWGGGRGRPLRGGEDPWRTSSWPTLTLHPSHPQCATYKLCHPEELVLLGHSLGIPQARLSSCSSKDLQLTSCLGQLHSGLFLYQGLLQALAGVSSELASTVDLLQLDVKDFTTNIWQQVSLVGSGHCQGPTQSRTPKAVLQVWGIPEILYHSQWYGGLCVGSCHHIPGTPCCGPAPCPLDEGRSPSLDLEQTWAQVLAPP